MISEQDYEIAMRSLKACIHHLQTIDLDEMAEGAQHHGSAADTALIAAVRAFVWGLPPIHP